MDQMDECVCFFLELASLLLYIKTLHISVSPGPAVQPLSGVNVTRENIDRGVECGAESAAQDKIKVKKTAFDAAAPLIINSPP